LSLPRGTRASVRARTSEVWKKGQAPSDGGWSSVLSTATSTCFFFPLLFFFSFSSSSPSFLLLLPRVVTPPPFSLLIAASYCSFNKRGNHGKELLSPTFSCSHAIVATTPPIIRSTRGTCRPCFSLQTGVDGQATRSSNSWRWRWWLWLPPSLLYLQGTNRERQEEGEKEGSEREGKEKNESEKQQKGRGGGKGGGAFLLRFLALFGFKSQRSCL